MRETPTAEDLDRLVASTAPDLPEPSAVEVERVWGQVHRTIAEAGPRRRSRTRLVAGAAVAAVVLGTSTVAAAQLYSSHTGKGPSDAEDVRLGGPGERLDPAAPDYPQVVAEETKDIPFPDASSRRVAVQAQVDDGARAAPHTELLSSGALRAWVADAAMCAWSNQWAAATRAGDESARAEATRRIQDAPGWSAVIALDPHPSSKVETMDVTGPDGTTRTETFRDDSQFFYLKALGRAVEGRDIDAVARLLAKNNGYCVPALVPDIPNANPIATGQ